MPMTISLTTDAERVLRGKVRKKYGAGAYLSSLILAEAAREELRREMEAQQATKPTRQSWATTGLRVD